MTTPAPGLSRFTGLFTVLMTLAGWSAVPLFLKHFSHSIDVWTSNGWRYGFSALIWAPLLVAHALRKRLPPGLWRAALVPAAFNAIGQVAFAWAHYKIDPGLLTFGLRLQIIFVACGAALLFPAERALIRTPAFLAGLGLVFAGTLGTVLMGEGFGESATTFGIVLAVFSGAMFACYGLSVRYFMQGIPPMTAFATISQYTAAAMVVLMVVLGDRAGAGALDLPGDQFLLLLLSSVIGIALGHVFYYIAIARLGVAVSSGVIQLQPFAVGIASTILFHEVLKPAQWASGVLAVAGAVTILWVQHRMAKRSRLIEELPVDQVVAAAECQGAQATASVGARP